MPAGATYEPIATTTLASLNTTISFTSIPSTYTDLKVVFNGSSSSGTIGLWFRFNNDSATNYSSTWMVGNGTTASSTRTSNYNEIRPAGNILTTTNNTMVILDLFSYAGSTNKTCLIQVAGDQNGSGSVVRTVGLYRSTSAINRIDVSGEFSTNLTVGSTATLYGIKNSA